MWLDESCSVVQRQLQALLPANTAVPWSWVARQLIETLRRFPAGVTEVRGFEAYHCNELKNMHSQLECWQSGVSQSMNAAASSASLCAFAASNTISK
jgi:Cell division control protein 24, OB domain 1